MQAGTRELKEMLFYLIEGIVQWERDFTTLPDKLYKGHLIFMKHRAMVEPNIVSNIFDLIKTLKLPSNEWKIPHLDKIFSPEAALIEPLNGLTTEADDFINSHQTLDESDQNVMRKILTECRDKNLDVEYKFIRTFLSTSENAVVDSFTLARSLSENLENPVLKGLVFECYEELPEPINNFRKCPHCGWTLKYREGNWYCNKENVCHIVESFEELSNFHYKDNEKIYRLTPGIQRYILLPGIQETSFAKRVQKKGHQVELYPEVDKFDLRVESQGKVIDMDMKDYRSTSILADYFNCLPASQLEKFHPGSFIVIPSYRLKISPAYIKLVNSKLNDNVKKSIRIVSENNMLKRLKAELG